MDRSKRPQPGLGRAVRQLREEQRISQEALAAAAGLTAATIGLIERGQANPKWDTVKTIAAELGLSISELARLSEKLER